MSPPKHGLASLLRQARAAVSQVQARNRLVRAWELLHVPDADGNPTRLLPYTDEALRELEAAHEHDPEDVRLIHHLAIAHHARAWDLELQGRLQAAQEWTKALGYWNRLAAPPPFWEAMKQKLQACDPGADPALVTDVQRDLLLNLLDVHVDFVRYYCESDAPEQAIRHVNLIRAAHIPPALRQGITARVFAAMTGAIPDAKEQRAFAPALVTIERFLALFPTYLPALRVHVELCSAWVSGLSFKNDWEAIEELSRRAEPFARQLDGHPELGRNQDESHLARAALEALASEMTQRGYDRTHAFLGDRNYADFSSAERVELGGGLSLAITWGRLVHRHLSSGSRFRELYGLCLLNHAFFLHQEAMEVQASDVDERTKTATCVRLYRQAVAESEEAQPFLPESEVLRRNLGGFRQVLEQMENLQILFQIDR